MKKHAFFTAKPILDSVLQCVYLKLDLCEFADIIQRGKDISGLGCTLLSLKDFSILINEAQDFNYRDLFMSLEMCCIIHIYFFLSVFCSVL